MYYLIISPPLFSHFLLILLYFYSSLINFLNFFFHNFFFNINKVELSKNICLSNSNSNSKGLEVSKFVMNL